MKKWVILFTVLFTLAACNNSSEGKEEGKDSTAAGSQSETNEAEQLQKMMDDTSANHIVDSLPPDSTK